MEEIISHDSRSKNVDEKRRNASRRYRFALYSDTGKCHEFWYASATLADERVNLVRSYEPSCLVWISSSRK